MENLKQVSDRLDSIEEMQQQTLWLLKGNESLQIEGVIPAMKSIKNDLNDLKAWRDQQEAKRRMVASAWKWVGGVIAAVGTVFAIFEGIKGAFS